MFPDYLSVLYDYGLTEKHSLIKQLDNEILELIESENDIDKEIKSTSEFSDKLQIAVAKLEHILTEQSNKKESSTITTESLVTNKSPEPSRVRLPNLEIPKFSGDALQWKIFGINTMLQFILQQ